ncbi:MAG: TolC family protein, partial [Desulfobacterales bacterium]|nr:TolC family protein [Desulfobacterales bacterium]
FRAQAELSKSKTDKVVAEHRVLQNKAQIVQLTGVEPGFTISDQDVPKELDNFMPILEEIRTTALDRRYEIKEAEKALEVAQRSIKLKEGDFWPTLSLEGGYQESEMTYRSATVPDTEMESAFLTAELQFTLYDGGLRRAEIRQSKAQERKAQEALSLAKKNVVLQTEVSYLEFETSRKTLINLQDELRSAEENWNAVSMQFKYGLADSIDLMDANTLLVTAQRRISNAQYDFYQAALKLIHTQGGLLDFLLTES